MNKELVPLAEFPMIDFLVNLNILHTDTRNQAQNWTFNANTFIGGSLYICIGKEKEIKTEKFVKLRIVNK